MTTKTINHIYELYPIYKLIYGTTPWHLLWEAEKILHVLRLAQGPKYKPLPNTPVDILEVFSGVNSDHEGYLRQHAPFLFGRGIGRYIKTDLYAEPSDTVVRANLLDGPIITDPVDIVISGYLSMNAIVIGNGNYDGPNFGHLVTLLKNAASPLKAGGLLTVDCSNGTTAVIEDNIGERTYPITVPYFDPIREWLKVTTTEPVKMTVSIRETFDFYTNTLASYVDACHFHAPASKVKLEVKVRHPFIQRLWSTTELTAAAEQAGLTVIGGYCGSYDSEPFEIPRHMTEPMDFSLVEYPNIMVFKRG